ncbi:MAG: hypothetical protein AAB870_02795 [Patescibacteria group bacterium]
MQYAKRLRIIAIATSAIVLAAVVVGLMVVGSPSKERAYKRDQQRISNLQEIENDVITYWQAKKKLPEALTDLNDATRGITIPNDPQTNMAYTYTIVDSMKFKLCARFEQSGQGSPNYRFSDDTWNYNAGETCFDRHIDPDFYGPLNGSDMPFPMKPVPVLGY